MTGSPEHYTDGSTDGPAHYTDRTADPLTAALAAMGEKNERWIAHYGFTEELMADSSFGDVRTLLETARAAWGLAAEWLVETGRLDARANTAGGVSSALLNARAQAREDCARELLDTIGRVLLGEERTDG
jgi:hypothetical protein